MQRPKQFKTERAFTNGACTFGFWPIIS